ncbi:MAG: hypothetical protein GW809_06500 [Bacteroidetes bacterium]|nr:hypothetical protein [Bacteroidota bacterium]NCQ11783.1 hypothetical protein [Bacteroidota bacterium]
MIAQQLKTLFDPLVCLELQTWENFEKLGVIENFPKETVIKEANTTENYLNFIVKGSGGNLIWNKNNFVCIDIVFENDFLSDYMSFTLQKATPNRLK